MERYPKQDSIWSSRFKGGIGGKGGNGGSSYDGVSFEIKLVSGSNYIIENNIDLSNQPVIYAEEILCTNELSNFESLASTNWGFGNSSNPNNASGNNVQTQFTSTGFQNIEAHGEVYRDFVFVNCEKPIITESITNCDTYTWFDGIRYTESNNLAIRGVVERKRRRGSHVVTLKTEHHAVLDPLDRINRGSYEVTFLEVGQQNEPTVGKVNLSMLRDAIRPDTCLVSVMLALSLIHI